MHEESNNDVIAHAQAEPPVVPMGGCIVFWTAAVLKEVSVQAEAKIQKDKANGVESLGGCIIFWF